MRRYSFAASQRDLGSTPASIGLYGLLSHIVGLRPRELAVRVAMGARPGQLHVLVLGRGMALATIGVLFGLAKALATGHLLGGLLYGVKRTDTLSLASTCVALLATAVIASFHPAHRAAAADPAVVLRQE